MLIVILIIYFSDNTGYISVPGITILSQFLLCFLYAVTLCIDNYIYGYSVPFIHRILINSSHFLEAGHLVVV